MKRLNLMVACAENRAMGLAGGHPWRIPEDLRVFHEQTAGQIVVLGRICYQSWPRAALDGRRPIVITSDQSLAHPGVLVAPSVPAALALAEDLPGELCVTGGERVFAEVLALPRPITLHLTLIHADIVGDRFFPEWRHLPWRETFRRASADENYRYTFLTLELDR
jgi:dihydrofolate reductase